VRELTKWNIYTPDGVQDILFDECFMKRSLEQRLRSLFSGYGYYELETPTIEYYDVFASEVGNIPQENMYKFFDQQGRILVLRPDITIPVARITATKYREEIYPLRVCYLGNVFRYNDFGGGKQNEFTQAGVEVLGAGTPEADAEVISIAVKSLKECGLENFRIEIGQEEFFNGIMDETGLSREQTDMVRLLLDKKDFVGLEEFLNELSINKELKKIILRLSSIFNDPDLDERLKALNINGTAIGALENIKRVLRLLEDYGISQYVSVDLGMLKGINYDTGIIFKGYTYGVGFPILTGGRYDRLVGEFGKQCPATGFSLGINLIMMALQRQNKAVRRPGVDSIICYSDKGRKIAFEICDELRRQGLIVETDITGSSPKEILEYAKTRNIGGVISITDEDTVEIHYVQSGEVTRVRISDLLKR